MANKVILTGVISDKPDFNLAYGEVNANFNLLIKGATGLTAVQIACAGDLSRKVIDCLHKNSAVIVIGQLGSIIKIENGIRKDEGIGVVAEEIYPAEFPPIQTEEDKKRAEMRKHIEEELAKLNDDDVPF